MLAPFELVFTIDLFLHQGLLLLTVVKFLIWEIVFQGLSLKKKSQFLINAHTEFLIIQIYTWKYSDPFVLELSLQDIDKNLKAGNSVFFSRLGSI